MCVRGACMCVFVCVYIHIYVCVCVCVCVSVRARVGSRLHFLQQEIRVCSFKQAFA